MPDFLVIGAPKAGTTARRLGRNVTNGTSARTVIDAHVRGRNSLYGDLRLI